MPDSNERPTILETVILATKLTTHIKWGREELHPRRSPTTYPVVFNRHIRALDKKPARPTALPSGSNLLTVSATPYNRNYFLNKKALIHFSMITSSLSLSQFINCSSFLKSNGIIPLLNIKPNKSQFEKIK